MCRFPRILAALLLVNAIGASAHAVPVINELMVHPAGIPENPAEEWIEIYNPGSPSPLDLSGWKLSKGVKYTIPNGTTLASGGYLVIAADVAAFQTAHAGFSGTVVGGWTGRLSGSGERVELSDQNGVPISDVRYADEGDWATRVRGELDLGHRGWVWESRADGGGSSLEMRNRVLGTGNGQNWGASTGNGGTPGAANSLASTNIAPLIKDVKHRPELPRSTDPIVISCDIEDEGPGATAVLRWRIDGGGGAFASLPMSDTDGDGDVEATIPAQSDRTVIEWYIAATDGTNTRTWPAPARTSNPGAQPETFDQVTNALVQIDNSYDPAEDFTQAGRQPIYRLIMTAAERAELAQIGSTPSEAQSLATMNGTFISHDGTGIRTVYNSGFRNRGLSSALGPPNNFHVNFRSDDLWNGRSSFQLNAQFPHSQALGNTLFARAGIAPQAAAIVRLRVNAVDVAESGSRMLGRYVRLEGRGGEWAEKHYPDDPDGNFYRLDDHEPGPTDTPPGNLGSGEFRYEGTNPASYSDTFIKETNKEENDYTDLIDLTRVVSAPITGGTAAQPAIPDSDYVAAVSAELDLDEFFRYIATDALIGNQEGGLQSGRADDVSIYAGVIDPRFRFIPHDLDDVFDIGNGAGNPITRSIFSYDELSGGLTGLTRLFNHPQLVPRYYAALLEALDTWFTPEVVGPIIDQIMGGWVPAPDINNIKGFIAARRANVLGQIQQNYSLNLSGTTTSPDGYPQTNDGAVTFNGTFKVAQTYSITVNGVPAQWFYRNQGGGNSAGTWRLALPSGGGGVLHPGLNKVVVNFWDGANGSGNVLQQLTTDIFYNVPGAGTTVGGSLSGGSLRIIAPGTFLPGKPFLVRVDQLDTQGELDRTAWTTTVSLSANSAGIAVPDVTLYNGTGSALVTAGGGGGGAPQIFFRYGSGGTGAAGSGSPGSTWKSLTDLTSATIGSVPANWKNEGFNDASWASISTESGYGDNDENTPFTRVDYDSNQGGTQSAPSYLFRNTFTVADVNALASVTGEVKFDDSCAVYVNGTQVYRHSDLSANAPLTEYTEVTTGTTRENATAALSVPLSLLHNGANTIAVEVHQHDPGSSDVTFDLRLQADFPSADPGNFILTATGAGFAATKALTSLGTTPAMTNVSGSLPVGTTNWSGVIHVTGDVTVPTGATLQIAAGTHVLFDGDATAGSSNGADLIVNGTLRSQGTAS
ncbi:MAG: CotH kinase family protein, partial [Chthoniobacteraceae bacterium]